MNVIPIVFAFDNNLIFPACVCISSLLMNANEDTFYDIFILYSESEILNHEEIDKIPKLYSNCNIHYRTVGDDFENSFEIRGITTPAYYRLLIPELVPEYDKIIYSDVDVIFRDDLSEIYAVDISGFYIAGVNSLSHLMLDYKKYYEGMKMDASKIIYSGNLLINSKLLLEDNLLDKFRSLSTNKFKYQDMDIINIVCCGRIKYVSPSFCLSTYISEFCICYRDELMNIWTEKEINDALNYGVVHYNGKKPWEGYCINFDIWWEYYRKSPFFNEKFYFDFFYNKLNEFDYLSLWKRIKILIRYFIKN